jgi:aminodeoxyfutalosine synthase
MGMKLAQVALNYGVDDIDGTVIEEKIYHMAGARTPQQMAREELERAIRETGREPVQRDSLYQPVKRSRQDQVVGNEAVEMKRAPMRAYAGASNEGGAA